jgi:hypothetical protein
MLITSTFALHLLLQIHHAHALLLVLGSPQYMTRKISSTLVSALVSGVPVVADDATLAAYTFLKREHVFYMAPGEDEMAVMLRVRRPEGFDEHYQ